MRRARGSELDVCITDGRLVEAEIARCERRMDAAHLAYGRIITRAENTIEYHEREAEAYRVWRQTVADYEAALKKARAGGSRRATARRGVRAA